MPRALWKGAITFGLVHIPVGLYPAAREHNIDFDWLDRRSMKPVGYKRVNKATGREVSKDDIVRGLEVEDGKYVALSDDEIRAANSAATQAVEIQAFIDAGDVSPVYFERPYVLAPAARGEKVYRLLRDALKKKRRVGIAQVVIQSKQHLAALIPMGDALVLNTLRWADELRSLDDLALPRGSGSKKDAPGEREMQMAEQLIDDMSEKWQPEQYEDHFKDDIMALVQRKLKEGKARRVEPLPAAAAEEGGGAEVIDLTELLKRSLGGKAGAKDDGAAEAAPRKKARRSAAGKKTTTARRPAAQRARARARA